MQYFNVVLNFLNDYYGYILTAIGALLVLFGVINWSCNVYRRQNKKMATCTRFVAAYPDKVAFYARFLPETYRRQWRAFVNSGASKPSTVFEFVPMRAKTHVVWMVVVSAVCSSLYVAVFALVNMQIGYILFQVAFWLAFGLIMVVNKALRRRHERHAKQIFGKLVALLNAAASLPQSNDEIIEETVSKLNSMKKADVTDSVIGRASELLRANGLDGDRTVAQQRRLNVALNGLLQAYARNSSRPNA